MGQEKRTLRIEIKRVKKELEILGAELNADPAKWEHMGDLYCQKGISLFYKKKALARLN